MATTQDRAASFASTKTLEQAEQGRYIGQMSDTEKSATAQPETQAPPAQQWGQDAPDGGLAAWLVVLGAWCTSFCTFGWLNSIGVFQEFYQENYLKDYSASTVSWIPSLQVFFMMAMGPIIGIIYDKYGVRHLLAGGTFLHVFGLMMCSLSTTYYQLLLSQGVCSAIGVSAIFQPAINSIHGWFTTKRGAAFGILATGSSMGGVIFPIMVSRLIKEVGFPWAMRICAFLILALLIIANLTVRPLHPPRPKTLTKAAFLAPFSEVEFVFLVAGFFCFTFAIYVPINYLPVQALTTGMDPNLIQYLLPILNAASFFGRIFSGFMADKIGKYNIFIGVGYLTAIFMFGLWLPDSRQPALIAFAAIFGFCSGAYVSLIAPLVAAISPMSEIGWRTGLVFFVSSIGGLTTSPIVGAIIDGPSHWVGVKVYGGVFCIVGTSLILVARIHRTGWKLVATF